MNNKLKIGIIIVIVAIGLFILPLAIGQQNNDYRAYVASQFIDEDVPVSGANATLVAKVTYVPVYSSATYTLTSRGMSVLVDLSQPTIVNDQIESAVKALGASLGYNVIKVYQPSYEAKYDPWTYVIMPTNITTSSSTSVPVTNFSFTPLPNTKYEVEVEFMVRSPVVATVGPRPGLNWPSGLVDGTAFIQAPSLQTVVLSNCNIELPCISPIGGLTTTTGSYGGFIKSIFGIGPNPSGDFQVTLASEIEGTDVMMMRGSFLKYRVVS